jgi:ABC-type sugar transport system ATPase subunit
MGRPITNRLGFIRVREQKRATLEILRHQVVRQGKACIYISHNMQHVYRLAYRVVVLDRGAVAGEYLKKELSLEKLGARLMRTAAAPGGNRT